MSDVECPYCGTDQEINHDDGYGYDESQTHEQECVSCEKLFAYTTSIMLIYEVKKADCLNDGNHDYKPTMTVPRRYTKMRCRDCGQERPCTKEELEEILSENQ